MLKMRYPLTFAFAAFVLALAACGGSDSKTDKTAPASASTTAQASSTTASGAATAVSSRATITATPDANATAATSAAPAETATTASSQPPAATNTPRPAEATATSVPPTPTPVPPTPTLAPSLPMSASVTANSSNRFVPYTAEVAVGGTVTWSWANTGYHDVTSGGFDSPTADAPTQSASFSVSFGAAGTYSYSCSVHKTVGMVGMVKVGG